MKASEIREMTSEELHQRLRERYEALMSFKLQQVAGTVDNVRAARNAHRDVARIKTILREREIAAAKEAK